MIHDHGLCWARNAIFRNAFRPEKATCLKKYNFGKGLGWDQGLLGQECWVCERFEADFGFFEE
jgi:hypothetical protein